MIRGVLKGKNHQWSLTQRIGAPQRNIRVVPGSWIDSLMQLGKAIMLCMACEHKMGKAALLKFDYQKVKDIVGYDHVIGDCDGCRSRFVKCKFFQKRQRKAR